MNTLARYTGTDNLEVMKEAVKYNAFFHRLVQYYADPSMQLLDFGAGIGTFADTLKQAGYKVACVEPDIDQSRVLCKKGFQVYQDVADVKDESVDYIYSLNVLEHIEDDEKMIRQLAKKIKPNGLILIYVPAFNILFSSMDKKVGHFRRYRLEGLKSLIANNGFCILKSEYVDSLGFFATLVFKLIGTNDGSINKNALIFYDRFVFPLSRFFDGFFSRFFGKNVYIVAKKGLGGVQAVSHHDLI